MMAHELVVSMSFPFECNFVREYLPPALISTKKPKDKGRREEVNILSALKRLYELERRWEEENKIANRRGECCPP